MKLRNTLKGAETDVIVYLTDVIVYLTDVIVYFF